MSLSLLCGHHLKRMADQLVDSSLPTTRSFWRTKAGATEAQANDPRPFKDVLARTEVE